MSSSRAYDFHQQEVDDLKAAASYTLAVCTNLKRMLEGIHDDQPRWASNAICELLDPNYERKSYVNKVDHLITPVSVPVNVPRRAKMHRGPDGIHYEDKFPLVIEMREEPLAHHAAWVIHHMVVSYLWSVWRRGNPGLIYCDALQATYELVGPRWNEIREELRAFVDYDCDGLRRAVEEESKAAIARCRQTIVGDATPKIKPETNAEMSSNGTNGNEAANACEEELRRALGTYQIRIKIAATLTPEQRRNIIMAYWGLTPAKARDKWKIMGWSPSLGTEGKTKLAGKVKTYINRGKEKLAELAGKK